MPYDERDTESGRFTPTFTDEQFLDAVDDLDTPTTNNVAEAIGCKYRTAYARLTSLDDEGRVTRHEIGNTLVWEVVDDE
ncbi:transcriptional regulator [Haladaptatus sp. NG-SE-30]